jgi:Ala-tRNA(Pro) deacylase
MPINRLKALLDDNGINYESIPHPTAYTAQGIAALAHIPGREFAKTVIVRADDKFILAVVPGPAHVDLGLLKRAIGALTVRMAHEEEFKSMFPGCELGAMPPFGNLYNLSVYVDESLAKCKEIAFNACTHQELLMVMYADFQRLVKPIMLKIAQPAEHRGTAA